MTAVPSRALTLVKTATPATYDAVGDVISYSYTLSNSGNVTLAGPVTVTDDKVTVSCPAGSLAPRCVDDLHGQLHDQRRVTSMAVSVTNIASAAAGTTVSPSDARTVTAVQTPKLNFGKDGDAGDV